MESVAGGSDSFRIDAGIGDTESRRFSDGKATKTEDAKREKKFNAQQGKTRRLMLDLAADAYQLDQGHRPTNVTDLLPGYLKAAPIDPLTGKGMMLTP